MKEIIKELKRIKLHKETLFKLILDYDLKIQRLQDEIQDCRNKQSKAGYEVEQSIKRIDDLIAEL